jgi:hypothetical protein
VAITRIERWPLVSTGVVHGVVQGVAAPLSIAQLNSTPPSGEPKLTVVLMSATVASSAPSMVTSGATVSTRNERTSLAPRSVVRTTNRWPPSASAAVGANSSAQASHGPLSRRHSVASVAVKANTGRASVVAPSGPDVTWTSPAAATAAGARTSSTRAASSMEMRVIDGPPVPSGSASAAWPEPGGC